MSEIFYCGACEPSYRPYLTAKILGDTTKNNVFMPYKIDGCELIENC